MYVMIGRINQEGDYELGPTELLETTMPPVRTGVKISHSDFVFQFLDGISE